MFLRTALQIHGDDLPNVKSSYDLISTFHFMPASPILLNSGTPEAQLSSCFLMAADSDAYKIFDTLSEAAEISSTGGGLGIGLQALPANGWVA
jgi:ribonucleotide reductase alpha subunit